MIMLCILTVMICDARQRGWIKWSALLMLVLVFYWFTCFGNDSGYKI